MSSSRRAPKIARIGGALLLGALAFQQALAAPPPARKLYSEADFSCTNKESWIYGPGVGKATRTKLKGPPSGRNAAVDTFIAGYAVKLAATTPEVAALGEYYMYRSYFELGLIHFADRGFSAMLNVAPNPTTIGIKLAALSCLNEIHRKYPSLGIAYNTGWSLGQMDLRALTPYQRNTVWQAMATVAGRKIFISGRNAQLQYELPLLQGSGAYEAFVRSSQAMMLEQDTAIIGETERFLKFRNLPEYLRAQTDGAHLNLARAYYQQRMYDKSVAEFKKVKSESNFFSRSLNDVSWSHLMLKNYSAAAGSSYNLMVGNLRKTFAPEAPVVIGMALFENCHNKEAQETLTLFKRTYDKTYHWLYDWYHQSRTTVVPLYPLVVKYLQGDKGVPDPLASEWVRSPVFIALQQELNLSFDEKHLADELVSAADKVSKTETQKLKTTFKGIVAEFVKKLPNTQTGLVEKINKELATRNNVMIAGLVEAFETAQLIEVEIYNQAGEDMVRKVPRSSATKEVAKAKEHSGPPSLDWGSISAGGDEETETWDDELGAIKTDVSNICKKK
jgi:tetratricopeptide (TPR) repeat protein